MTINDLELYLVEVPCAELSVPVRSVLARLTTDSGREGWGEAPLRLQAAISIVLRHRMHGARKCGAPRSKQSDGYTFRRSRPKAWLGLLLTRSKLSRRSMKVIKSN